MNEINTRLSTLKTYLKEENIDLAMITYPPNVFYYTGFNTDPHERFLSLMIDTKADKEYFFVPELDAEIAKQDSIIQTIIPISDAVSPFDVVKEEINLPIRSLGIEKNAVTVARLEGLNAIFDQPEVLDIQDQINAQRMKKSAKEIKKSQVAIDIIERVLEAGMKKIKVGMTEAEVTAELEFLMRKFGSDGPSFTTIALSGPKSALPHGSPDERKIEAGDFLLIDMGVIKDGYVSDITRTFVVGEASEKQKEIYDIVLKSNEAGINAIKVGAPMKEFDLAARKVIHQAGYGDYFHNRVGHGLGIEVHEAPSIHGDNEALAETGLLFTIEPGIYIPGFGGVRIEDNVFINEQGQVEVLTSFPKNELIEIK